MDAEGSKDKIVLIGLTNGDGKIGRPIACSDGQNIFQSCFTGALDDGGAIRVELLVIQVTVGIYELHLT